MLGLVVLDVVTGSSTKNSAVVDGLFIRSCGPGCVVMLGLLLTFVLFFTECSSGPKMAARAISSGPALFRLGALFLLLLPLVPGGVETAGPGRSCWGSVALLWRVRMVEVVVEMDRVFRGSGVLLWWVPVDVEGGLCEDG